MSSGGVEARVGIRGRAVEAAFGLSVLSWAGVRDGAWQGLYAGGASRRFCNRTGTSVMQRGGPGSLLKTNGPFKSAPPSVTIPAALPSLQIAGQLAIFYSYST